MQPSSMRRTKIEAHIKLDNLIHNYDAIKEICDKRICCVVKADAYGHGAVACVRALAQHGADAFAVSSVEEAIEVRTTLDAMEGKAETEPMVLILGYTLPEDVDLLCKYRITQTVFSLEYAEALAASMQGYKRDGVIGADAVLPIHIKLDTGMNRLGFRPWDEARDIDDIVNVCAMRDFLCMGLFTHFSEADTPHANTTEVQYSRYMAALEALEARGVSFAERHVSNSAAITNFSALALDERMTMVRLGIELYGLTPSLQTVLPPTELRPVMTLETVISHIHTVHAGECVSYSGVFSPKRESRIATLPIGYADGFLRVYGNGGYVTVNGQKAPICGRICMDQCMIDVTDLPDVAVGDTVTLFGEHAQSVDEIAARANTIGYEVISLIGKRVPRIY